MKTGTSGELEIAKLRQDHWFFTCFTVRQWMFFKKSWTQNETTLYGQDSLTWFTCLSVKWKRNKLILKVVNKHDTDVFQTSCCIQQALDLKMVLLWPNLSSMLYMFAGWSFKSDTAFTSRSKSSIQLQNSNFLENSIIIIQMCTKRRSNVS